MTLTGLYSRPTSRHTSRANMVDLLLPNGGVVANYVNGDMADAFIAAAKATFTLPLPLAAGLRRVFDEGAARGVQDRYAHGFDHFIAETLADTVYPWPLADEAGMEPA